MTNKDKTGTERQQRRREREWQWLKDHGFTSWEQLHTLLMDNKVAFILQTDDGRQINIGQLYKKKAKS